MMWLLCSELRGLSVINRNIPAAFERIYFFHGDDVTAGKKVNMKIYIKFSAGFLKYVRQAEAG